MFYIKIIILLIISSVVHAEIIPQVFKIKTVDNREIVADLYRSDKSGKLPGLVICPGQGYHRQLPLITELANKACAEGFNVLAIDWSYFTDKGNPSADLSKETMDLQTGIDYLTKQEFSDSENIYLAGKSFGSVIAYNKFLENISLKGLFLLTPLVRDMAGFHACYPDFAMQNRPITLITGNTDRGNCPLDTLYKAAAEFKSNVNIIVVNGDHGLNVGDFKDEKIIPLNRANLDNAVNTTVFHMKMLYLQPKSLK